MALDHYAIFRLPDPKWYESFDVYKHSSEFTDALKPILPKGWFFKRSNVWLNVGSPANHIEEQGWKIHISATQHNAIEILLHAAETCFLEDVTFKFAADKRLLNLMTSKGWAREAAGKFITIYPKNQVSFEGLLEALYHRLNHYNGPYILSDKRFKDSKVLHYRYGGMSGVNTLSLSGEKELYLTAPDGTTVPDVRTPYFYPPRWTKDPFPITEEAQPTLLLKGGRYQIERALSYSVTGGVYKAIDLQTETSVVIKEARPYTGVMANRTDATTNLKREYQLLRKLEGFDVTPRPIDFFEDWEHNFLVEEFIPGEHLGITTIKSSPLIRGGVYSIEKYSAYVDSLRVLWTKLIEAVAIIHNAGIVLGDLSLLNIIVNGNDLRIIDLEAAYEEGVDEPTNIYTPGYTVSDSDDEIRQKEDDYYALGAVMLGTLFPINSLLDLEPNAKKRFTEALATDYGLSKEVEDLILAAMSNEKNKRPHLSNMLEKVQNVVYINSKSAEPIESTLSADKLSEALLGITSHIISVADPTRKDRLFPADPIVFYTNSLSVAAGASGVAYALSKITGEVPSEVSSWILSKRIEREHYPPGLYFGSSGICWSLWEMGYEEEALSALSSAHGHVLLPKAANLFYGAAGYGLTCLRMHQAMSGQKFLDQAVQIGNWIFRSKVKDARGFFWPDENGKTWLGYARGSSGIALFLLYLYLVTGEDKFYKLGVGAIKFDLSFLEEIEQNHLALPRGPLKPDGTPQKVLTHYWLDGSAGISSVLLRYYAHSGNQSYLKTLKDLIPDVSRRLTIFPGLFRGLAGLGNFLLDTFDILEDPVYLEKAHQIANGILMFAVKNDKLIAFPGDQLYRISTDYGTGSSGIALFLHRLRYAEKRLGNFNFMLDELITPSYAHDGLHIGDHRQ